VEYIEFVVRTNVPQIRLKSSESAIKNCVTIVAASGPTIWTSTYGLEPVLCNRLLIDQIHSSCLCVVEWVTRQQNGRMSLFENGHLINGDYLEVSWWTANNSCKKPESNLRCRYDNTAAQKGNL